jgi:NADPH-dependent curcumin reductase CurA
MTRQSDLTNRRFVLAAYAEGQPTVDHFRQEYGARPEPGDGEFLVRTRFISVDPMIRIFIDKRPLGGSVPTLPLGAVIPGAAIGEVVASRHAEFPVGSLLEGRFGWQDFAISRGAGVRRIDPALAPPEAALGALGLPGFTAFVGLHLAGPIAAGQTVLVSGAAGAVGSVVGALARARSGRLVGFARGDHKRRYLHELGYEAVIDRTDNNWREQLASALPGGADVYFDNVGGSLFAEVLPLMARNGRVMICGLMAQYNGPGESSPAHSGLTEALIAIMGRSLTVRAFASIQYENLRPAFLEEVGAMVRSGALPTTTHIEKGFERTPAAFLRLFEGGVAGKIVVQT